MISETELKLYYLGDRDYVNGLTLFEESLRYFFSYMKIDDLSKAVVRLFKVTKFIRTHVHLEIGHRNDREQRLKIKDSSGQIDLAIGHEEYRLLLFSTASESKPVTDPEYNRGVYVKKDIHYADGRTEAVFHNVRDSYELLRGVIEVNQRFTVSYAPQMGLQKSRYWGYMTNYKLVDPSQLTEEVKAVFTLKQTVQQQLRTLIIRGVSIPILAADNETDLCFFN